ncbi:hypothetical protein D3C86_2237870 [compost metagenome]
MRSTVARTVSPVSSTLKSKPEPTRSQPSHLEGTTMCSSSGPSLTMRISFSLGGGASC